MLFSISAKDKIPQQTNEIINKWTNETVLLMIQPL